MATPLLAIRRCLLLGALGDALGSSVEGANPAECLTLEIGPITDDTQLSLATCEAIVTAREVSPEQIAATFAAWHQRRRFRGLGSSTLKALTELAAGQHWALAGAKGERAAGNGAAMRIAPLAFCIDPRTPEGRRTIRDVCRLTHHHDEAYLAALAIVLAIRATAYDSVPLADIPARVAAQLPDSQVRDQLCAIIAARPASIAETAQRFGNSGFVAHSIPFALFAASQGAGQLEDAILRQVISTGGDADTNASLVGQILGAHVGCSAVPEILLQQMKLDAELVAIIDHFVDFCSG